MCIRDSLETNVSKLALLALLKILGQHHIDWLDTQMITPVVENLGGEEISRLEFLKMIQGRSSISKEFLKIKLDPEELRELILT